MKIVDLIPQIYTGLGEIDQQQLKMSIVLQKLNSVLCKNLKELNLSDLNWFMQMFEISVFPEIDDYQDFPSDWGRQIHAQWSIDRQSWAALDLINVNYLDEIGNGQRPTAGIYGTPPHLKIHNVPFGTTAVQIWYEPDKAAPLNWNAELSDGVRNGFEPGILAETQFLCAPFVTAPGLSQEVMQVITWEMTEWRRVRDEYRFRPRVTGRVPKRGFSTGRPRWR